MDALDSEYDKIRGVSGAFAKARESARLIAAAKRDRGIDASINFTLMKDTIGNFESVKRFADEIALPVSICLVDNTPYFFRMEENKSDFWIKDTEEMRRLNDLLAFITKEKKRKPASLIINAPAIKYIRNYFKDPLQKNIPCVSSQDRIIIDPYGNYMIGCLSMGSFGNIREKTLKALQREHRDAKRNMFYKVCPGCSCGYLFNMRCMYGHTYA